MDIRIFNVIGDGNCYYRCLWRIAKEIPSIAEALMINDLEDETAGAEEIRYYVALSIQMMPYAQCIIQNLIELYKDVPDLIEQYPVLNHVTDVNANIQDIFQAVSKAIRDTNVMASSLEHEIIAQRLYCNEEFAEPPLNYKVLVLTQNIFEKRRPC